MKLVSFSPWQHTVTSVPLPKNEDDIIQNFILSPLSSGMPPVKRMKPFTRESSKSKPLSSSINMTPMVAITSNHTVSVLGHQASKKLLHVSSSGDQPTNDGNSILNQVPQWIYTSRPGPKSSFLPSKVANGSTNGKTSSKTRRVGAVVDAASRTIFALQKDNEVMKIWGLEDDVNGPDEDGIQEIEFDSPVLCMSTIPSKPRQVTVKIKGNGSGGGGDYLGGVAGLLGNGQMFVVLVSIVDDTRRINMEIYGKTTEEDIARKSQKLSSHKKKKKKSLSREKNNEDEYLYSVVNYSPPSSKKVTNGAHLGSKRKLDNDGASDEWGEVTLTVLSKNAKNMLSLSSHSVLIPSSIENNEQGGHSKGEKSSTRQRIGGKYSNKVEGVTLPHDILKQKNGSTNGSSLDPKDILVTQLDPSLLGISYQHESKVWHIAMLNIHLGVITGKPFPISHSKTLDGSSLRVIDIAGLQPNILSILTSDDALTLYDLRRSTKLYSMSVRKMLGKEENGTKYKIGIAAERTSGSIGIICNTKANGKNGSHSTVSISCARVGLFDEAEDVKEVFMGKVPFARGSYNLAKVISSSLSSRQSDNANLLSFRENFQPMELDMVSWFASVKKQDPSLSLEKTLTTIINELEMYRRGPQSKLFSQKVEQSFAALEKVNNEPNMQISLPQIFIDITVSIAMSIILSQGNKPSEVFDAATVLIKCIRTKMISGRSHFDKANISCASKNDDVLRSLLFALQTQSIGEGTNYLPIQLISSLLQNCKDGLTEQMYVTMVHFIMCHATEKQLAQHWNASHDDPWYTNWDVKVIEKRLNNYINEFENAKTGNESTKNIEILQKLVEKFKNRLAVSQQLFLISRIVTHSECNPALLRTSLRNGLTQVNNGEVEVLMLALGKLLQRSVKDGRKNNTYSPNKSRCISQWLSAVVDSNLPALLMSSDPQMIDQVGKVVSSSISQTKVFSSLQELITHTEKMIDDVKKRDDTRIDVVSVPKYGIEPLIF